MDVEVGGLIIVGDGPQRESLQLLRDHYGSQDACRFVGHRTDAAELLTAFDLLLNGSLYECQSNTILEAMATGVPVIATDIPGNRDLVRHGQTGYLYPQGDVAQLARVSFRLLSDPGKLQAFGEKILFKLFSFFLFDLVPRFDGCCVCRRN